MWGELGRNVLIGGNSNDYFHARPTLDRMTPKRGNDRFYDADTGEAIDGSLFA